MKKSSVIAVLCSVLLVAGFALYFYKAFYSRPPGFDECYSEVAPPVPASIALPAPAAVTIPPMVQAETMLLPDIPGIKSMPPLRAEAARQKASGSDALIKAVVAFQRRSFIELFTADDSVRQEARKILLLLAGADKVEPGSRGRFIDARLLAVMERFGGERYLQLGEFPNPTPPASGHLAESFDKMLDVYFYMLAMSGAGQELYAPTGAGLFSGFKIELNRKSLDEFIAQAAAASGDAAKRAVWLNALRVLRKTLTPMNPLLAELDAAIRASLPGTGVVDIIYDLEGGDARPDDVNVLTMNPGAFDPEKIARLKEKAKGLTTPAQKTAYWTNVVRLARQGLAGGWGDLVATKNMLGLDAAIRETAPHENLKAIQDRLQKPVSAGSNYYVDPEGHRTLVQVTITKEKPGRTVCLKRMD